jgi:hypothetical protein
VAEQKTKAAMAMVQYARCTEYGNSTNGSADGCFNQLMLYGVGGTNVAYGATVTITQGAIYDVGEYNGQVASYVTSIQAGGPVPADPTLYVVSTAPAPQQIVIQAAPAYVVSGQFWTYWGDSRTFHAVQVELSLDGTHYWTVFGPQEVQASVAQNATSGLLFWSTLCLAAGTMLAVPGRRERAIEDLGEGDAVETSDGRVSSVVSVVRTRVHVPSAPPSAAPWRIPAGLLGARSDLVLSANHGVVYDGHLVPAALVPGAVHAAVDAVGADGAIEYYHVRLERGSDMLVANGVAVESLRG